MLAWTALDSEPLLVAKSRQFWSGIFISDTLGLLDKLTGEAHGVKIPFDRNDSTIASAKNIRAEFIKNPLNVRRHDELPNSMVFLILLSNVFRIL